MAAWLARDVHIHYGMNTMTSSAKSVSVAQFRALVDGVFFWVRSFNGATLDERANEARAVRATAQELSVAVCKRATARDMERYHSALKQAQNCLEEM